MASKLTDKVRSTFERDNVQVNEKLGRIEVYWMHSIQGRDWIPYGGGPLYGESAKGEARWLAGHIEEFRSLLPKQVRDWPVVLGELHTATFPGVFRQA